MPYKVIYSDSLSHHGILGQKWGVRRYQNYDGTYTKRGLERYRKASDKMESAHENYKVAKKSGDEESARKARAEYKVAKAETKSAYKRLKTDAMADRGRLLAKEGQTITGRTLTAKRVNGALEIIGGLSLGLAYDKYKKQSADASTIRALAAIGGLSFTAARANTIRVNKGNKELRSYYSH